MCLVKRCLLFGTQCTTPRPPKAKRCYFLWVGTGCALSKRCLIFGILCIIPPWQPIKALGGFVGWYRGCLVKALGFFTFRGSRGRPSKKLSVVGFFARRFRQLLLVFSILLSCGQVFAVLFCAVGNYFLVGYFGCVTHLLAISLRQSTQTDTHTHTHCRVARLCAI